MRIGLIRHGETDWNARGVLQGASDIPLNVRGEKQARDAGRMLRGQEWRAIAASPLSRARRTAEIIAEHAGFAPPRLLPGLVERSFGELEGTSVLRPDGSRVPLEGHEGVEPHEEVLARTRAALEQLARDEQGPMLVVTHGTVIRLLMDWILGFPSPRVSNLGLSIIELGADEPPRALLANGYPLAPLS